MNRDAHRFCRTCGRYLAAEEFRRHKNGTPVPDCLSCTSTAENFHTTGVRRAHKSLLSHRPDMHQAARADVVSRTHRLAKTTSPDEYDFHAMHRDVIMLDDWLSISGDSEAETARVLSQRLAAKLEAMIGAEQ